MISITIEGYALFYWQVEINYTKGKYRPYPFYLLKVKMSAEPFK